MNNRQQITRLLAGLALAIVSPAFAADAPPAPEPPLSSPDLVHHDQPNCLRWTDECVSCTRDPDGKAPICSNIGVSCQPREIRCLEPETPAKPATK